MSAKKSPMDVTGRAREDLAEQLSEEVSQRAEEMSLATATAKLNIETQVIDATKPDRQTVIVDTVTKVGSQDDTVVIRVVETIENMTLGSGNNYSFKAGQKYEVTRAVALHLKEKGYLAANL